VRVLATRRLEEEEVFFGCPHCGAEISMLLDLSAGAQSYLEDCEVCCRPIRVRYRARDGAVELEIEGEG
jgi:transcription elongation factor Elf1